MHACCTGVSSNHSVPRMSETKRVGSEARTDARGWGRSNSPRARVRAGQFAMRWEASSVAELQRGQKSVEEGIVWKRQTSDASPKQFSSNFILEMFFLDSMGKPRVTCQ